MSEINILALVERIPDEAAAYAYLEELRWDGHPECPHCGNEDRCYFLTPKNGKTRATRTGAASQRRLWKCGACRKQFSVLTNTVMHGTKIPVRTWCCPTRSMSTATTRCVETGSGRGEVVGRRCRRSFGGDLEGRPRWGDAFVVEPLDELEECLNGEHLGERVVFDVDRDDDAPQSGVHSAVLSVTAARAEDSSTMAFFAA